MHPVVPSWARRASALLLLLSFALSACGEIATPVAPARSVVEDTIETMDPGQTICDVENLEELGCTVIGDPPPPPPPPPGWEPCTSTPEGCYSDPDPSDPGDGGGSTGGAGGDGGAGGALPGDVDGDGDTYDDGLFAWGSCLFAVMGLSVTLSAIEVQARGVYDAAGALDGAERTLQAVQDPINRTPTEVILLYQYQRDQAQLRYNDAKNQLALAAGASGVLLGGAIVACAPFLLLPTP
jgi:hypothetical protein